MGTCQDKISPSPSQYLSLDSSSSSKAKGKPRRMTVHSSRHSYFSFDPVDPPPHEGLISLNSGKRSDTCYHTQTANFIELRRRQSFNTQMSGSSSDKKDSLGSNHFEPNEMKDMTREVPKRIKRVRTCET